MLKVENLKIHYGGIEAVKGISFDVPDHAIVTLIGANGAGKSSTLRTISGLVKASEGSIVFDGEDITNMPTAKRVEKGIVLCPEGRHVFPDMTVLENIKIGAYLRNDALDQDIEEIYGMFPRLKERSWQLAGTLSGGEQQMLAVARSLMSKPKIMPTSWRPAASPSRAAAPSSSRTTTSRLPTSERRNKRQKAQGITGLPAPCFFRKTGLVLSGLVC